MCRKAKLVRRLLAEAKVIPMREAPADRRERLALIAALKAFRRSERVRREMTAPE